MPVNFTKQAAQQRDVLLGQFEIVGQTKHGVLDLVEVIGETAMLEPLVSLWGIFARLPAASHIKSQTPTTDFSFCAIAETPSPRTLRITIEASTKRTVFPRATRECQKKCQFGASRLPSNQATHKGPSHVRHNSPKIVPNFPIR